MFTMRRTIRMIPSLKRNYLITILKKKITVRVKQKTKNKDRTKTKTSG